MVIVSEDQVLALAPDPSSVKAGKGLATSRKWVSRGTQGEVVWGECQGSGKNPYQTRVDLSGPAYKCSCPSRKFPCKHAIGLMLLYVKDKAGFAEEAPPDWVAEWLSNRQDRAEKKAAKAAEPPKPVDEKAQAKRLEKRESNVSDGVAECKLWLSDLVRTGFASASGKAYKFWDNIAARMVDCQAPGIARLVRDMAEVGIGPRLSQGRLLEKVGRLHLLLEAWGKIDTLPTDVQEDIRATIGFNMPKESVLAGEGVRDSWLVTAHFSEPNEYGAIIRVQYTWLRGCETGRDALILTFAPRQGSFDFAATPGSIETTELFFYPSATPLRALMKDRAAPNGPTSIPGSKSLESAFRQCTERLAANPWLERLPVFVSDARLIGEPGALSIVDSESHSKPVSLSESLYWKLLSFTGGKSFDAVCEWDLGELRLLGAFSDGHYIRLYGVGA